MSNIELRHVTKRFPGVTALKDVSFDVKDGEFFILLGPTGAGKTTTLRVLAGLVKQEEGSVFFDDEPVDELEPADRDVAFVFQQYSLYPTLSVYDNLAFPLRSPIRRIPEDEIEKQVERVAEVLRISDLLYRKTARLSGAEMQRVSTGRAIVRIGLDILFPKLRFLRGRHGRLVQGTVFALPFGAASFDAVICSEVLEHVSDEAGVFKELTRVLRPGGTLILGTPDYGRWLWWVLEWIYGKELPGAYAHEHITHPTQAGVAERLRAFGYTILELRYVGFCEMIFRARKERRPAGATRAESA